jgi:hypothetical protein
MDRLVGVRWKRGEGGKGKILTEEIYVCGGYVLSARYPLYVGDCGARRDEEFGVQEHIFCTIAGIY